MGRAYFTIFSSHVDSRAQSLTGKSYKSAIKTVLRNDGNAWNDEKILLDSLTRACHIVNDRSKLDCQLVVPY